MFKTKVRVVVGITTFYNDFLGLSVPALRRLPSDFMLIVYNDNPDTVVKRGQIRRLGYSGPLRIINGAQNVGVLQARLNILEYVQKHNIIPQWVVLADDDDILVNIDTPNVGDDNFAVIQNMAVIKSRLVDVMRAMNNPQNCVPDSDNIELVRPHVGLAGTLVRWDAMCRMGNVLRQMQQEISDIDESLSFRPPVDPVMWNALTAIVRNDNPQAMPIYMDAVNYIATNLDRATTKYGMAVSPAKNAIAQIERALAKYDAAIKRHLATNAAPMVQNSDE